MSRRRLIRVYTTGPFAMDQHTHIFRDWYAFADWLKEETLNNQRVTIYKWEYFDGD